MTVSFYLRGADKKPQPEQQGAPGNSLPPAADKRAIFARICYKGYKTKYYIGESINPTFWDRSTQRAKKIKTFNIYPEFNARLDNIESAIKKTALKYANEHENKYPTPDTLKNLLNETGIREGKKKQSFTLLSFFDLFIADSAAGIRLTGDDTPITAGTIKTYETTKKVLQDYQTYSNRVIEFSGIDLIFYEGFKTYLTQVAKHSTNYIGKHIKTLKAVLRYAKKPKFAIAVNAAFEDEEFKTISEKVDRIYLTESELKELAELDLSDNPTYDKIRDLFIVGCNTGLRYSDNSKLRKGNIIGEMISLKVKKTQAPIMIPMNETISAILLKYGGDFPPAISEQKTNEYLKLIGAKCKSLKVLKSISITKAGKTETATLPKHEFITTHTQRRSFCTNEYLLGTPAITIMAISGHKTESAFMKYLKLGAIEHANNLIDIRAERKLNAPKRKII